MVDQHVDILIVGGGLIGATLMLALRDLGYTTLMVEEKSFSTKLQPDFDARSLALSPASVQILQMLQLWPILEEYATPIKMIHASEQSCFGHARLHGKDHEPLGYVVEMHDVSRALHQLLDGSNVLAPAKLVAFDPSKHLATIRCHHQTQTIKADLIVAADGVNSAVREYCDLPAWVKDYDQHAIVSNIGLARAHQHEAYERFTATGPLALLPMQGLRASLVWALSPAEANRLMSCSEEQFLKELQVAFGYRLGRFVKSGQRMIYPLRQVVMQKQWMDKIVFVGNAAHTLHPVAGQGFNLGLRDVAMLAQCIARHGLADDMLHHYQEARRVDQDAILRLTDSLIQLFTSQIPGLSYMRGLGLMALDNVSILKNILMRVTRGYVGFIPDLVCGIPLRIKEYE